MWLIYQQHCTVHSHCGWNIFPIHTPATTDALDKALVAMLHGLPAWCLCVWCVQWWWPDHKPEHASYVWTEVAIRLLDPSVEDFELQVGRGAAAGGASGLCTFAVFENVF